MVCYFCFKILQTGRYELTEYYFCVTLYPINIPVEMKKLLFLYVMLLATSLSFISCSDDDPPYLDPLEQLTDYSDAGNWAEISQSGDKGVDVFFLYPTVYSGTDLVAEVSNAQMREGVRPIQTKEVSIYRDYANVFLPYYRQLNASQLLGKPLDEQDRLMRRYGAADAIAAFDHYLENFTRAVHLYWLAIPRAPTSAFTCSNIFRTGPECFLSS